MIELIKEAMLETNEIVGREIWSDITEDTILYDFSNIESINFVSFILLVEQKIEEKTGKQMPIVTDKTYSRTDSPFRTVGTLATFLVELCVF